MPQRDQVIRLYAPDPARQVEALLRLLSGQCKEYAQAVQEAYGNSKQSTKTKRKLMNDAVPSQRLGPAARHSECNVDDVATSTSNSLV